MQCAVAVVGYDLYPIADGAAQVDQVDQAIRWAEAGAPVKADSKLLVDGGQVVIAGHSAGGHLSAAALLGRGGENPSGAAGRGESATIAALALLSAPLELRRHVAHEAQRGVATISALSAAFVGDDGCAYVDGDEAALDAAEDVKPRSRLFEDSQPLAQLSPEYALRSRGAAAARNLPPRVALFHGDGDPVVPVSSTRRFEAALRDVAGDGQPSVVADYRNCSHLDYLLDLVTSEEQPHVVNFLRECWH